MNQQYAPNPSHEVLQLAQAAVSGQITPEEAQRLEQLVVADAAARDAYVSFVLDTVALQDLGADRRCPPSADASPLPSAAVRPIIADIAPTFPGRAAVSQPPGLEIGPANTAESSGAATFWLRPPLLFALMLGSALVGGTLVWNYGDRAARHGEHNVVFPGNPKFAHPESVYAATLVNVTNCHWETDQDGAMLPNGSQVTPGQSLNLIEGIAEIAASFPDGDKSRFVLEGPLGLDFAGKSASMLHFGKLFAAINPSGEPFVLNTALGRISVSDSASFGIVAANQAVTLHVFAGEAAFELRWADSFLGEQRTFDVGAGSSLRLTNSSSGELTIDRGVANDRCFTGNLSMAAHRLNLDDNYVETIRSAKPLAYWRFESLENGFVRNEMGDKWNCRIRGTVESRDYLGNRSAEMGVGQSTGYLISDDNLGSAVKETYTLETWFKPSHMHAGALVSLIDWTEMASKPVSHGALLCITGPAGPWSQTKPEAFTPQKLPTHYMFHPERIRFLHRNPLGLAGGTDAYSERAYEVRQWHHAVCVKDKAEMRIYINGAVAAKSADSTECPPDLRILIGQLYPSGFRGTPVARQFIGELDETAIYDRALSEAEIKSHYRLVQNKKSAGDDN